MAALTPAVMHVLLSLAGGERHGYAILKEVLLQTERSGPPRPGHHLRDAAAIDESRLGRGEPTARGRRRRAAPILSPVAIRPAALEAEVEPARRPGRGQGAGHRTAHRGSHRPRDADRVKHRRPGATRRRCTCVRPRSGASFREIVARRSRGRGEYVRRIPAAALALLGAHDRRPRGHDRRVNGCGPAGRDRW